MAALCVLALHLALIGFNILGCVLIPLGAWRRWHWVRGFWWRLAHIIGLALVALQALLGRACFLTLWQADLAGSGERGRPLIAGWINHLVYWPLPLRVFAAAYVAVFVYVVALWVWVRPTAPFARKMRP